MAGFNSLDFGVVRLQAGCHSATEMLRLRQRVLYASQQSKINESINTQPHLIERTAFTSFPSFLFGVIIGLQSIATLLNLCSPTSIH